LFRSRVSLQADILTFHQKLKVLQWKDPARPAFRNVDRLILSVLYRVAPDIPDALTVVMPEAVIRWLPDSSAAEMFVPAFAAWPAAHSWGTAQARV
jgi:hypothetical protein